MINFTVYGDPVPWGRPRFVRVGNYLRAFVDKKTAKGKEDFIKDSKKYCPEKPWICPIRLRVYFYLSMLKSFSAVKRAKAESGLIRPAKRPDADNYLKLILDAMNKIFYNDDGQVVDIYCHKFYSTEPRITVYLEEI